MAEQVKLTRNETLKDRAFEERMLSGGSRWWKRADDGSWAVCVSHKGPYVGPRNDAPVDVLDQEARYWRDLALLGLDREAAGKMREDAERYRVIRNAGSQLKLWLDDDWYYKPRPELVDEYCDAARAREAQP